MPGTPRSQRATAKLRLGVVCRALNVGPCATHASQAPPRAAQLAEVTQSLRSLLYRYIWRSLPAQLRQALLIRLTTALAPLPDTRPKPGATIIVAGALRSQSGLGQSARLCHDAFKLEGFEVFGIDLCEALMLPQNMTDFVYRDGRGITGPGVLIVHVNAPYMGLALLNLGKDLIKDKTVVGYWHWELPIAPANWSSSVKFVHEIWTPSNFTATAIAAIAPGCTVRVVAHPVALGARQDAPRSEVRVDGSAFTALSMFDMRSSLARKNPIAAISAFRRAFGDDPSKRLVIKTINASLFEDGRRQLTAAPQADGYRWPLRRCVRLLHRAPIRGA